MQEFLFQSLEGLFLFLITLVAAFLVQWLRRCLGVEGMKRIELELKSKQQLAAMAVRFVEQFYRDLNGTTKYNEAAMWLSERLKELGFKISDEEIRGLIESALRSFKDEFGEQWAGEIEKKDGG